MKPTKRRLQMLQRGNVFDGLQDIKNTAEKRRVESLRHCQLLDMTSSILVPKIAPEVWAKEFIKNSETKRALRHIDEILKTLTPEGEPHPLDKPYFEMKITKKNIEFYTIARNWIKNHAN